MTKPYREHLKSSQDLETTYEAVRAGLDPQLVLSVIQVESSFKKYAVSTAGARGYMQVMPFWAREIGVSDHNLFHLRTNLRYGCTILRHYLDIEKGNYFRALGRYNGSLGQPDYPDLVMSAWHGTWAYPPTTAEVATVGQGGQLLTKRHQGRGNVFSQVKNSAAPKTYLCFNWTGPPGLFFRGFAEFSRMKSSRLFREIIPTL
mgnify:CR=1 FL=1